MQRRTAFFAVGGLSAALAGALVVGHLTGVCYYAHGGQFSPDTFRERSYKTYVLGPTSIPWYGRERETSVSRYLASNSYIHPPSTDVRWFHTVGTQVGWTFLGCSFGSPVGALASRFGGELGERLVAWSERRPDLAKAFWPKVVEWTQGGRCADAAMLLEEFERSDDPETIEELESLFDQAVMMADEEYGPLR